MKQIIITALSIIIFHCALNASSISIPEKALTDGLKDMLSLYNQVISKEPVESWEQLARVTHGFEGINSALKEGSATDYFSFIPLSERSHFPKGNLILVQYRAMPWPDAWKQPDPNRTGGYLDRPSQQEFRYLIYEANGRYIAERWYENKFQSMLAVTGLKVPPPTPYSPQSTTPPDEKSVDTLKPAPPVATSTSLPAASPPAEPSNPLWWIIGAIAALAAVVFIMRKKKPKA